MTAEGIRLHAVTPQTLCVLDSIADPDIFDDPLDSHRLARFVEAPGHRLILALDADAVVGQVCAIVQRQLSGADELFVDNLGVAQTHRRRGIGSALWQAAVEWGRAEGCGAVWVATQNACAEAVALYRALRLTEGTAITFETELE